MGHNGKGMPEGLHIPCSPRGTGREDISRYIANIEQEIGLGLFTPEEISLIRAALYGRFLDLQTRPFFLYHFLPLWERAIEVIFKDNPHPKVIELGCGTGTSSLLFSLLGAEVIGVDLDADLIALCNKRAAFYRDRGCAVDARFYSGDSLAFDFDAHAPVDAVFSLFAFNLMKPCDVLLCRMVPALKPSGKIVIIDGNAGNLYARLVPSRRRPGVLTPERMQEALEALGCAVLHMETHCCLPPFLVNHSIAGRIAVGIEQRIKEMNIYKHLGVSYTVVGERVQ